MDPTNPANPLASLQLRLYFDTEAAPQVSAPVDAFFINRFDLKGRWPSGKLQSMFIGAGLEVWVTWRSSPCPLPATPS